MVTFTKRRQTAPAFSQTLCIGCKQQFFRDWHAYGLYAAPHSICSALRANVHIYCGTILVMEKCGICKNAGALHSVRFCCPLRRKERALEAMFAENFMKCGTDSPAQEAGRKNRLPAAAGFSRKAQESGAVSGADNAHMDGQCIMHKICGRKRHRIRRMMQFCACE